MHDKLGRYDTIPDRDRWIDRHFVTANEILMHSITLIKTKFDDLQKKLNQELNHNSYEQHTLHCN